MRYQQAMGAGGRWSVSRRTLLKLGSAGFASAAFLKAGSADWPGALWPWADQAPGLGARVAVGYWKGSDSLPDLAALRRLLAGPPGGASPETDQNPVAKRSSAGALVGAGRLLRGDPRLAWDGVRVEFLGMQLPPDLPTAYGELRSWEIDVQFQPDKGAPFHAWRFDNGSVPKVSAPTSFVVPVGVTGGLQMTVGSATAGGEVESVPVRLTLGWEPYVPKLRRGVYVVALPDPRTGILPDWGDCRLGCADPALAGDIRSLYRSGAFGGEPVAAEFPYLVFAVDEARNESTAQV